MERLRSILKKLLFPGRGWVLLIALAAGAALALTFLVFGDDSPFAYAAYLFSAYALTAAIASLTPLFARLRRLLEGIPLADRWLTDRHFKVRSNLILSFFINLCYAGFKLVCAVGYSTFWDGALAVYYILLCAARLYLIRRVPEAGKEQDMARELRVYRATGIFLFALDVALSGVATQIVMDGYGSNYPGMLIYVMAAYAFYTLAMSIVNLVKYRKLRSPVLSAAKAINLTTAVVSMFNLETAMIAQFGAEQTRFRLIMTACTAFFVCVIVLGIAGFMVISSSLKLYSRVK